MINVTRYKDENESLWDRFVTESKNGIFLFYRNYMEYHSDRFIDHSLLFFDRNRLIALLPANSKGSTLLSHGGLTLGGFIFSEKMKTPLMLKLFNALIEYLRDQKFKKLIYKPIPHIYHSVPAEEDLYALFLNNAKIYRRDVSSTIFQEKRPTYSKGRIWSVRKAKKGALEVSRSFDFKTFMGIEEENLLKKYGVKPTHTSEEIEMLAQRFPENIKLFTVIKEDTMLGGVIIYESQYVAHTQYIAATDQGKEIGALDVILDYLINEHYAKKKYFDFGISTEDDGKFLNTSLIQNKESYGARATVYDFYQIDLK